MSNLVTLSELLGLQNEITAALVESGGEITPELDVIIQTLDLKLPAKVDSYVSIMVDLEKRAEAYREQSKRYSEIAKRIEKGLDEILGRAEYLMATNGIKEIKGVFEKLTLVKNPPALQVADESIVPEKYKTVTTTVSIDKKRIISDIKSGEKVDGCELSQGIRVKYK